MMKYTPRRGVPQRANQTTALVRPTVVPGGIHRPEHRAGVAAYTRWHWGARPTEVLHWADPDYPKHLVACGRFIELVVQVAATGKIRAIQVSHDPRDHAPDNPNYCVLAYDKDHPYERLYICLTPKARQNAAMLYDPEKPSYPLARLAAAFPGRHATRDYPAVRAQLFGTVARVTYGTLKKGDGPSHYVHRHGEATGKHPGVAVDATGRLWIVGGDSVSPVEGITD